MILLVLVPGPVFSKSIYYMIFNDFASNSMGNNIARMIIVVNRIQHVANQSLFNDTYGAPSNNMVKTCIYTFIIAFSKSTVAN